MTGGSNMADYPVTTHTDVRRRRNRASWERRVIHGILDAGFLAHVATVVDGEPYLLPMLYVRSGEHVILHGSSRNRLLAELRRGAAARINVTLVDGLVLGRTIPDHSANYRSVTIFGHAQELTQFDEKLSAMRLVFEHMIAGRWQRLPDLDPDYLMKSTVVLTISLTESVAKVNDSRPEAPSENGAEIWAGVIPLRLRSGVPMPDAFSEGLSHPEISECPFLDPLP